MNFSKYILIIALSFTFLMVNCSSSNDDTGGTTDPIITPETPPVVVKNEVDFWLTKGDQSVLLKKQNVVLGFGTTVNNFSTIEVNPSVTYQTVDGFGYTLTGGSAQVINDMAPSSKKRTFTRAIWKK